MSKRSYKQNCSLARAADVVGERWTLLLVRDLLLGSRRFSELNRSCKGMGPNLLTRRLREFEEQGLVCRETTADGVKRYALTPVGRSLEPVVLALIRWGLKHTGDGAPEFLHLQEWDLVALKALFRSDRAAGIALTIQFITPDFSGWVHVSHGNLESGLGKAESCPDVVVHGSVSDLFIRDQNLPKPRLTGNVVGLQRFIAAFAA